MRRFLAGRWFLLCLCAVLLVGFPWAEQLAPWIERIPRTPIVAGVLFLMALPLELAALGRTLLRPGPALLATGVSYGLLPLLAWGASRGLPGDLATGLLVASVIPCTLASAAVWTRRAGGNDAVAILVTVITNLICFVVTPAWLWLMTRQAVGTSIDFGHMVVRLLLVVVVPIAVAQTMRVHRPLAAWATRHKIALGVLPQIGILTILLIGAVGAGQRLAENESSVTWQDGVALALAVSGVHLAALVGAASIAAAVGMSREDRIAVAFAGSQKTLMVGLDISLLYGGLVMLPLVAYHVAQLILDTLVADWFRARGPNASGEGNPQAETVSPAP